MMLINQRFPRLIFAIALSHSAVIASHLDAQTINSDKSLVLIDPFVVDDGIHSLSRIDNPAGTGMGRWSFGGIMERLAGNNDPAIFTESFLDQWITTQTINAQEVAPDPITGGTGETVVDMALSRWCRKPDGKLDLAKAPFRLLGITNRIDVRHRGGAGELHFIYNLLETDDQCALAADDTNIIPKVIMRREFVMILEWQQPASSCSEIRKLAKDWLALSNVSYGGGFNTLLRRLTDPPMYQNESSRANGSMLNALRAMIKFGPIVWHFREFHVGGSTPIPGSNWNLLSGATLGQTPKANITTATLENFLRANQTTIENQTFDAPLSFEDAPFAGPVMRTNFTFRPADPSLTTLGQTFNKQTCNGCHDIVHPADYINIGGIKNPTTTCLQTNFNLNPKECQHGRDLGKRAQLSLMMTNSIGGQPSEIERRRLDLLALVNSSCPGDVTPAPQLSTLYGFIFPDGCNTKPLTLTFDFKNSNTGETFTRKAVFEYNNRYSVSDIPRGLYSVRVRLDGYLRAGRTILDFRNAIEASWSFHMYPGDVNGDNKLDSLDINALNPFMGSKRGDANWSSNADVQCDGIIDSADLTLLQANIGKVGYPF